MGARSLQKDVVNKYWGHSLVDYSQGRNRRCTNPFAAVIFIFKWSVYIVLVSLVWMSTPTWQWLKLTDSSGRVCGDHEGGSPGQLLAFTLNKEKMTSTAMFPVAGSLSVMDWVLENKNEWSLIEDYMIEEEMYLRHFVDSCETFELPGQSAVLPLTENCNDERFCMVPPVGLAHRPALNRICLPNSFVPECMKSFRNPLVVQTISQSVS